MKILIVCGGNTAEKEISIKSGKNIYEAIKNEYSHVELRKILSINDINDSEKFDLVFIALHGGSGENGEIQQFLQSRGVAYTGPNPESCALAFDRFKTKELFSKYSIPTPKYTTSNNLATIPSSNKLILKPRFEGSSIGVTVVEKSNLNKILKEYPYQEFIVEEFIAGKEITVGFLGNQLLPIVEISFGDKQIFDFNAKYNDKNTIYTTHAKQTTECNEIYRKVYKYCEEVVKIFKIDHLSRIDIRFDSNNNSPYFLEVNSIPGFSDRSLVPMAAKCVGLDFKSVCKLLINCAIERNIANVKTSQE